MTSQCLLHFCWKLVAVEGQRWIWWLCDITGWALDIRNIGIYDVCFLLHLWMTSVLQSLPLVLSLVPVRILWGRRHTHPQMHCTHTDCLLKPSVVNIKESCEGTSWENRASEDFTSLWWNQDLHLEPKCCWSSERILMCHQSSELLRGRGSDLIVWPGKCPFLPYIPGPNCSPSCNAPIQNTCFCFYPVRWGWCLDHGHHNPLAVLFQVVTQ